MKKKIKRPHTSGQSLIEYLILVAVIAVGTMGVVRVVGANVSVQFANIAKALGSGDGQQLKAKSLDQSMYSKKDLTNFLNGSKSGSQSSGGE
jgi:pilus assembly protein Flp/PilA